MRNFTLIVLAFSLGGVACKKDEEAPPAPAPETKKPEPKPEPKKPAPPKADAVMLERGRYLVDNVALCAGCHTPLGDRGPDMSRYLAGGFEFPETFGTWRSPNITPDKKTGIGDWTDEQIATAIREGKRPNGEQLYPIMPYLRFNTMSDDDTKAVVAYLRTVKPVENAVKGNTDLKLPKIPAPKPTGKPPGDDPLKKGEYLANLMQCGDCHTPMKEDGSPDFSKAYAGGLKFEVPPFVGSGTIYSSNITADPDTGIGKYTEAQIIDAFTKGKRADGSQIGPPMMFLTPLWAGMKPDDQMLVAKYVKSIPPIKNAVPKSTAKLNPPPK